ncbi:MAG: Fic family protein [Bacteroides sp.]|nr:Fic family protein [Bacillota bacterium]MCM1394238.1 Fic family protein [[Eubacterium] siraeum]MCM1455991.1 Fic family protein [Bacteroides sp.]
MDNLQINSLVLELEEQNRALQALVCGSIEIRDGDGKDYIYLHSRKNGVPVTTYVGEYSDELYNLIVSNNIKAKEIKKEIRRITKVLKSLGYRDAELDEAVASNIDFARKRLADTIYKQAVLEGIATTYADTKTILEGGKVNNMTADDVLKVVNLKRAWDFILNKNVVLTPTNFAVLCEINKLVEEGFYYSAGKLRTVPVSIGGTAWKPSLPIEADIKDAINAILALSADDADRAIELLLYVMKSQIFIDGNKRTAVIFANHYLISRGEGLIVIPNDRVDEYKKLLIDYYEGNDNISIKRFLKTQCYERI